MAAFFVAILFTLLKYSDGIDCNSDYDCMVTQLCNFGKCEEMTKLRACQTSNTCSDLGDPCYCRYQKCACPRNAIDYTKTTTLGSVSINPGTFCKKDAECSLTELCVGYNCVAMSQLPSCTRDSDCSCQSCRYRRCACATASPTTATTTQTTTATTATTTTTTTSTASSTATTTITSTTATATETTAAACTLCPMDPYPLEGLYDNETGLIGVVQQDSQEVGKCLKFDATCKCIAEPDHPAAAECGGVCVLPEGNSQPDCFDGQTSIVVSANCKRNGKWKFTYGASKGSGTFAKCIPQKKNAAAV